MLQRRNCIFKGNIVALLQVCFVGNKRTYNPAEESDIDEKRSNYIAQRCLKTPGQNKTSSSNTVPMSPDQRLVESDCEAYPETKRSRLDLPSESQGSLTKSDPNHADRKTEQWASEFQPRNSKECSRNCRDVDRGTKESIVMKVFEKVLAADKDEVKVTADGRAWHKGGIVFLAVCWSFHIYVVQLRVLYRRPTENEIILKQNLSCGKQKIFSDSQCCEKLHI